MIENEKIILLIDTKFYGKGHIGLIECWYTDEVARVNLNWDIQAAPYHFDIHRKDEHRIWAYAE